MTKPFKSKASKANRSKTLPKKDGFSKNSRFIQRSRQMEKFKSAVNRFDKKAADHLNINPQLLPSETEDTNGFYEELIDQYSFALKAPTGKQQNEFVPKGNNSDVKENETLGSKTDNFNLKISNSFSKRFELLNADDVSKIMSKESKSSNFKWSAIGNFKVETPVLPSVVNSEKDNGEHSEYSTSSDLHQLDSKISSNVSQPLPALENEIFHILKNYLDLYFPCRSHFNAEEIRHVYCLHAINHMLKSRALILRNNKQINDASNGQKLLSTDISIPDDLRDQGFTRLKTLILLPFRESALKTVKQIESILFGETKDKKTTATISKYDRFLNDYSGNTIYFPKTNPKPIDYEQTFSGNTDDNFKLGIRFTKKSMHLFTDPSESDILIASPLAMRMIINDKDQNFDYLSSIELLIIDQAELFIAQNWENLLYVIDHLHLQPQSLPKINCQRVRTQCLNGMSQFYRQTLIFSSHELPEFRGLLNNKCHNYQGKVRIINQIKIGDITNVITPVEQVFQRINCSNIEMVFESRFQYFVKNILPEFNKSGSSHCLLYVPSYFDYVRLRNYFKTEMVNFVQISEYTKKEKLARARDIFFHSGVPIMLYSERAHFFRRTRIKGIRHLIFYQPPNFPHFYSELLNLMLETNQNPRDGLRDQMSVKVLYTKFDTISLSNIVGNDHASTLATSINDSYSFTNNV